MDRGLTSIPQGSASIRMVNFGFNKITDLPPFVFAYKGFVDLQTIHLRRNQITTVSKRAFKDLKQLKDLYLQENNVTGLELNTFKSNFKLRKLDLSGNRIRFRNRPFLYSNSLETLILSDNRIDQIFEVTFNKLPNLRYLVMNSNVLFSIPDGSFVPIKKLEYLALAHTGVYKLSEEMFKNGSYPKIIDLTDSPLASMFNPPLTKVKNEGVIDLISIDKYF